MHKKKEPRVATLPSPTVPSMSFAITPRQEEIYTRLLQARVASERKQVKTISNIVSAVKKLVLTSDCPCGGQMKEVRFDGDNFEGESFDRCSQCGKEVY